MTARELFEFTKQYNLENAKLYFHDGCYYSIEHARVNVDKDFLDPSRIILSEK